MTDYEPTPPPATPYVPAPAAQKSPVLSILSLVFGILGVLGIFAAGLGILPSIAGVVLGFIGRRKEPLAKGLWLTGLILSFVGIVIALGWILLFILAAVGMAAGGYPTSP